jgi:hypothetical protein
LGWETSSPEDPRSARPYMLLALVAAQVTPAVQPPATTPTAAQTGDHSESRRVDFSIAWLQAVIDELCRMLEPGKPFLSSKGNPSVVMFIGL